MKAIEVRRGLVCALVALALCGECRSEEGKAMSTFVRVSPRDCRYLELTDGAPYIPIGLNLVGGPKPEAMDAVVETIARVTRRPRSGWTRRPGR